MKWITPIVMVVFGVAAILLPAPEPPSAGLEPGTSSPPVAVCATDESGTRSTDLSVLSTVAGSGDITIFSGGGTVGSGEFVTGTSGSVTVPVGDVAAVGRAASLIEFPAVDSSAAAVTVGATAVSAETCSRVPDRQVVIGAGSTIEDRIFQLQLMNPYSAEAVADITAFSESGRESNDSLQSVVIPPRSSVVVDIGLILPGRESLVLVVDATRGSVVTSVQGEIAADSAVWKAVPPEPIWYLPVPVYSGTRDVVIANPTAAAVAYQIDVFGPNGLEEEALEGTISAEGQEIIDVKSISPAALAVRVVAEAPVAVFGRFETPSALGIGNAAPAPASEWLLPGAGTRDGRVARLVLVNVGVEETDATVTELRQRSRSRVFTLAPGEVIEVVLDEPATDGVSISSDGQLVPFWFTQLGDSIAVSSGFTLGDES